jgi:hypothetical protein
LSVRGLRVGIGVGLRWRGRTIGTRRSPRIRRILWGLRRLRGVRIRWSTRTHPSTRIAKGVSLVYTGRIRSPSVASLRSIASVGFVRGWPRRRLRDWRHVGAVRIRSRERRRRRLSVRLGRPVVSVSCTHRRRRSHCCGRLVVRWRFRRLLRVGDTRWQRRLKVRRELIKRIRHGEHQWGL